MEFDEGEKKQEIRHAHRKRGKIERKYIYACVRADRHRVHIYCITTILCILIHRYRRVSFYLYNIYIFRIKEKNNYLFFFVYIVYKE